MDLTECDNNRDKECPICTEKLNLPTELPCGHIFCYLCAKAYPTCALCRAKISTDFLDDPVLLQQDGNEEIKQDYQWYYQGDKGWWKYDERSNIELEKAFNAGFPECHLRIGRDDYVINFQINLQMRKGDRTKRRKVHRGAPTLPAKGVAGIKATKNQLEEIVTENEFNEADTISLYSNIDEAQSLDTDLHEMFRDFLY